VDPLKSYLNVFLPPNVVDVGTMKWIHSLGFYGARQGIRHTDGADVILRILESFHGVPELKPLFLLPLERELDKIDEVLKSIMAIAWLLKEKGFDNPEVVVEVINEPDLFGFPGEPEKAGVLFNGIHEILRFYLKEIVILSPSVSNMHQNGFTYFRRMRNRMETWRNFDIAWHRYPPGRHATTPHKGFENREREVEAIKELLDKPIWITETGRSQVLRKKKSFPFCFMMEEILLSEGEQTAFAKDEYSFWKGMGVEAVNWYQINDGPNDQVLDRFGIRRFDGTPKDIANAFPEIHRIYTS